MKNISTCVKFENKMRTAFLKKYANILLENFVPDLKNMIPDFPGPDPSWSSIDKNLPNLTNMHRVEDVALQRVEGEITAVDQEETKIIIDGLEAERKELRQKILGLEKRMAGMKIDISLLKEKVHNVDQE